LSVRLETGARKPTVAVVDIVAGGRRTKRSRLCFPRARTSRDAASPREWAGRGVNGVAGVAGRRHDRAREVGRQRRKRGDGEM
jgi:hypothetical protein